MNRCCPSEGLSRRTLLGGAALGVAATMTGGLGSRAIAAPGIVAEGK